MTREKTLKVISTIAVVIATILAWLSGYIVMQIVYDSIAASIVFGTVWAIIVFCESRFSYISLKSDGRIELTKEEIKSNLWQFIAATLVALLVAIPLELKIYANDFSQVGADLKAQLEILGKTFASHWLPMSAVAIAVIVIFLLPIIVRLKSSD